MAPTGNVLWLWAPHVEELRPAWRGLPSADPSGPTQLGSVHAPVGFPGVSDGKESACNAGDHGSILGREDPLEKKMAFHFSIPSWEIPWTEEPGRLVHRVTKSGTALSD